MAGFARKKRVTDPFDREARTRLVGGADLRHLTYVTGSEPSGDDDHAPCLSQLVHDFFENDDCVGGDSVRNELDSEPVDSVSEFSESGEEILRLWSVASNADPHRNLLVAHVSEAAEKFSFLRERGVSIFRRNVVAFLREKGHNAAICVTRWDSAGGVTAGNHEFIDVVQSESSTWRERCFVDLDFGAQFEIARPTSKYSEILSSVPGVFVGGAEELKCTVSAMCEAAKMCFRGRGLSVPPWRRNRFMQNKWFGPCRRITNPVQGNPVPVGVQPVTGGNCRSVGFDDVVSAEKRSGGGGGGGVVFVRTR